MAKTGVRNTVWTPDIVRERIQASQVANRLIDHVTKGPILEKSQVTAALGLLKKIVPDLSSVDNTHSGKDGGPILVSNVDAEL